MCRSENYSTSGTEIKEWNDTMEECAEKESRQTKEYKHFMRMT